MTDKDIYILNEHNVYITKEYIEEMLLRYNITHNVTNLKLYQLAMVNSSYIKRDDKYWEENRSKNTNKNLDPIDDPSKAIPLQLESNERLEFLGDAVIHLVLAEYIFKRYDTAMEGFMTKLRTKIENSDTLANFTKIIGLNKYILVSRFIESRNGREHNTSILEDAFESFVGALRLEAGTIIAEKFVHNIIEMHVDFAELLATETNYKDMLLKYFHTNGWIDPKYSQLNVTGNENNKVYTMCVMRKKNKQDVGEMVATGTGSSKKAGEQEAAKNALIKLKQLKHNKFGQLVANTESDDSEDEIILLE